MMQTALLLASALSANAFVIPAPTAAPMVRSSIVAMNEATRDAEPPAAPSSGWSLTMNGGVRKVADVWKVHP